MEGINQYFDEEITANDFWRFINGFECLTNALHERESPSVPISPNPVGDVLQLTLPENMREYSVHIFDTVGIEKITVENSSTIDVGTLQKGIYRLIIKSGTASLSNSFVKM